MYDTDPGIITSDFWTKNTPSGILTTGKQQNIVGCEDTASK